MRAFLTAMMIVVVSNASGGEINVTWEHPQAETQDIAEFRLYCDVQAEPVAVFSDGAARSGTATIDTDGQTVCHMTALDVYGKESAPSESVIVDFSPPSPPSDVVIERAKNVTIININ